LSADLDPAIHREARPTHQPDGQLPSPCRHGFFLVIPDDPQGRAGIQRPQTQALLLLWIPGSMLRIAPE
jgi:hypothetical protein